MAQVAQGQLRGRQRLVGDGLRARRRGDDRGRVGHEVEHRELARRIDADVEQPRALDLEHLHLQHHLRIGEVLRGDHLFREADRGGRVAQGDAVELLVRVDVARLQHGLHHRQHVLGLGVGQVERAHAQLGIVLLLGRGVRVDQHRVLVEHLALELVGGRQHADHVVDAHVADRQRHLEVGTHVVVEDEVQSGGPRERLEHGLEARLVEVQRDGLAQRRREFRRRRVRLGRGRAGAPRERLHAGVRRILGDQLVQQRTRERRLALLDQLRRLVDARLAPPRRRHGLEARARSRLVGPQRACTLVEAGRIVEPAAGERRVRPREHQAGLGLALADQRHAIAGVARLRAGRPLQLLQAFLGMALIQQPLAVVEEVPARRAAAQRQRREARGRDPRGPHRAPPSGTCRVWFSGT